jgi:hypothetical protein
VNAHILRSLARRLSHAALCTAVCAALSACGELEVEDAGPDDAGELETTDDGGPPPVSDAGRADPSDAGLEDDAGEPPNEEDAGPFLVLLGGEVYDAADDGLLSGVDVACSCGEADTTDADGLWVLEVPAGSHTLSFTLDGYETIELVIDTDDGDEPWASLGLVASVSPYVDVIDHAFLIEHFGGTAANAFDYDDDVMGFQAYLDDVGVQYFSANEIVTPNSPSAAAQCGYMILLPTRGEWEKIGALALMADQLRALVGEPVLMRNWWRPDCYNELVGGAAGGDHPDADAVDLDFQSATSRAAAQQYLCNNYWAEDIVPAEDIAPGSDLDPRLNMSVGLGGVTIHLGVLSANGRRFWKYGSYTQEPDSGSCW